MQERACARESSRAVHYTHMHLITLLVGKKLCCVMKSMQERPTKILAAHHRALIQMYDYRAETHLGGGVTIAFVFHFHPVGRHCKHKVCFNWNETHV